MANIGVLAEAIGLVDAVYKTTQMLKKGMDRKGRDDLTVDLASLQDLVQIHTNILTNASDEDSIKDIETTVSSLLPQLRQIESCMLQPSKRLNRLFNREPSWSIEHDYIRDVLKKSIQTLESSLDRYSSRQPLTKGMLISNRPRSMDSRINIISLRYIHNGRRQEILDWLSDDEAERKQSELCGLRVKGTGEWLNDSPEYKKWRDGDKNGQMWCFGNPGSGKSVLMSHAIDRLQEEVKQGANQKIAVVYYYFDFRAKSTAYKAMASLLRQLCYHPISLPSFLTMRWDEREQKPQNEPAGELQPKVKMKFTEVVADFISLMPKFNRVYVCLDGLDECSDLIHQLIPTLERLASSSCQLLLTSRHLAELSNLLVKPHNTIQIESFNSADIKLCLDESSQKHTELAGIMNEELALTVSKQLTERSHGNFLSVKLQFAELSRQTTTYELKESLKKLPTELADTYGLLLSSIADQPSKKADLAMRTLQWLAYSRRPLTLSELQQAVSIDPRDPSAATDPERLPPPLLILEVCKDLIEIRIEQNKVLAKHASLAHYLRNFRETLFPDGKKYIAESITSFFQNSHLSGGSLDIQEQYDARENLLPFSVYASQYWGFHLANHLAEYPAPAADAIRNILENESLLKTISQILHVSKNHEKGDCRVYPSNFGPLHFAVYFGLTAAVVDIVDKLTGFESMVDSWGRDAVHIACQQVEADRSSHCRRAQEESTSSSLREVLLIDRSHGDENLKAQSEDFLKIVNYLSNRGFLLDRRDHYGRVPLHWAVLQGSTRVVSVLGQQCRSSVRITDKWGRDPLYYAAERGNIELVSSLLGLGAAREGHALSIAASNGHRRTVEKLLAYGYDSNDDEALFEAARNGFTDIVSRLYRQGANQSWEDENGMAALHHAAHAGHAEITKYLVMEGADINKPDWTGRSPLLLASENGDLATIQLLIKRGAVVDTTDHSGNAALDKAAENGHPEVVRYLLRHGARTNSDGSRQSYRSPNPSAQRRLTPLQIAGKSGFDSVAQVLLEESSSPDKAGCTNRTPLSYAAEAGHESIVKLLLSTHRVDVNAEDELARTPLSYASEGGYVDIMKLLLGERGVDINTRDEKGRTPLSYAAEMGHVTAALLLLVQPGMIAMIADDSGLTPRDYARENGHSQVVMALDDKASIAKNGLRERTHKAERRALA